MATISSPGIGSGLDINSIITQLMAVEKVPLNKLQSEAATLQTRLSSFGKVQSALSTLRDAASTLMKSETWSQVVGSSSDSSTVAITTSDSTKPGTYMLEVQSLAASQSNATGYYASSDSLVGEGTLTIEMGSWDAEQTTFTPNPDTASVDISVGPPAQSLAQLRDKINGSNSGVVASILTDSSGSRLVLRSSATGVVNGFRASVSDTDGNNTDSAGLSALAFDPSSGILTMAQALAAANASASLNSLSISSASNTLTDVLDGMTLTLGKVTTSAVQVNASQDSTALRKSIDAFVSAYNDLNKLILDGTKSGSGTQSSGTLQGDTAAISIRSQMRGMIGVTSGASTTFTRLSDIGFDVQQDGSIKVSESKLTSSLTNVDELKKLFANSDSLDSTNNGIATQVRSLADQLLGVDGTVGNRSEGLRKRIELNQDRQEKLNDRIAQTEKRLRAQYSALDAKMGQLTGLSNYVTQQFAPKDS